MTIEKLGAQYLETCKKLAEKTAELKKQLPNVAPERRRKLYKRISEIATTSAYCRKVSEKLCNYYKNSNNIKSNRNTEDEI